MRCIIAGGRDITDPAVLYAAIEACPWAYAIEDVIEGGALGVDALAAAWAKERGLRHTCVPADWKKHGKSAGPKRNRLMASLADALIAIPGEGESRGTRSMIAEAERAGIHVFVYEPEAVKS